MLKGKNIVKEFEKFKKKIISLKFSHDIVIEVTSLLHDSTIESLTSLYFVSTNQC